jgi:hypothetical protein
MFRTFFLAGFEGTTGFNAHGVWIDQVAATQHDHFADLDYRLLREVGIGAVREAVRWPLVSRGGRYDFSSLRPFLAAARTHEVDVIWDLFHFGYPADADPFAADFSARFAEYCHAVGRHLARESDARLWFTPVNEPSYFAWAGGEAALFAPHARGRGPELKRQLAIAGLRGVEALKAACPGCGIVSVDALCHVVAPRGRPDLAEAVRHFNESVVFESLDVLAGVREPDLGGSPEHLGMVGLNYYWTNQWELGGDATPIAEDDERRLPLRDLVRRAWRRYRRDVLIAETSHVGGRRASWLRELGVEAEALLDEGVPLRGVCLYPVLGMPEWHARDQWAEMGLWDLFPQSPTLARRPHAAALAALKEAQRLEGRLAEFGMRAGLGESEAQSEGSPSRARSRR